MLTFLAFPVGGLPAIAWGGVQSPATALAGGAAAGLVIGAAQGLALPLPLRAGPGRSVIAWSLLSGLGLGTGLLAGSAAVDYGTSAADLAVQGLLSGVGLATAQAWALRRRYGRLGGLVWAVVITVLWPVGWTVTRLAGVSVEDRFAVFGATGALVVTAVSGAAMLLLSRSAPAGR